MAPYRFSMSPPFKPISHLESQTLHCLPDQAWIPILQHSCDFPPPIFESVALNLIKNPNINSNLLFRADILYDSSNDELTDTSLSTAGSWKADLQKHRLRDGAIPGFKINRTIVRLMVPRNPQLDKPVAQTCHFLRSTKSQEQEENLVVYMPHTSHIDDLPWYHPRVQSIAYLHTWRNRPSATTTFEDSQSTPSQGDISLHYLLFPSEALPLSERLLRTAHHLLSTLHKHGQGSLAGYTKRVHHDQMVSQQRLQDTYTELKRKHAKRLCDNWVEQTEPSKHVFEDLGIAAFLIELWKDMYDGISGPDVRENERDQARKFLGFVDIGCGNGVLVDVLLREGYNGWGFDARRRKTWATFEPTIQEHLKQLVLIPQPLFEMHSPLNDANAGILYQIRKPSKPKGQNGFEEISWHNGIFPTGTFIISNHADELTPWTPLLAFISLSPFLAIPCCSHNLSGLRFRAPSVFNSYSADRHAPSYFAANVPRTKAIAIQIASFEITADDTSPEQPATGDLKALGLHARAKQPSAYASLCDWVAHLAAKVGYDVEREMLRLPSTRNMGIVGRARATPSAGLPEEDDSSEARMELVKRIASGEKADGAVWVERARGLMGGKVVVH